MCPWSTPRLPSSPARRLRTPGQVPIRFRVEYDSSDIDSRNRYSVTARIIESDGRLAFINDTAYEVITRGNPRSVDMLLVLVEPPPEAVEEGEDWRTWIETPAQITRANLLPNEREPILRVQYYQPTIEGCARRGNESLEVQGTDIVVSITMMRPPPTAWAIPCDDELVELDTIFPVEAELKPGQTYRVVANGHSVTAFTLPGEEFPISVLAQSHILRAGVERVEGAAPHHRLTVVSARPIGSGCSRYNGYEVTRRQEPRIEVEITHHEVVDQQIVCTKDVPTDETVVPLGSGFEPGVEYQVVINSGTTVSFEAR